MHVEWILMAVATRVRKAAYFGFVRVVPPQKRGGGCGPAAAPGLPQSIDPAQRPPASAIPKTEMARIFRGLEEELETFVGAGIFPAASEECVLPGEQPECDHALRSQVTNDAACVVAQFCFASTPGRAGTELHNSLRAMICFGLRGELINQRFEAAVVVFAEVEGEPRISALSERGLLRRCPVVGTKREQVLAVKRDNLMSKDRSIWKYRANSVSADADPGSPIEK